MKPQIINLVQPVDQNEPDDFLILSSSWEDRCLGFAQRAKNYSSKYILINVYDNRTEKKENLLKDLSQLLHTKGTVKNFSNKQSSPVAGIKHMLHFIKNNSSTNHPKISIDISCFTRKHLLLLLNCFDSNDLLGNAKFYYSQPIEYFDESLDTNAEGIKSISEIETFSGENLASRDTVLLLFLNFEGKRAISLWNQIQPHITIPIMPFPGYKHDWELRVINHNKLLLSTLNIDKDVIEKASPLDVDNTKDLILSLTSTSFNKSRLLKHNNYNFIIAPLGTKAQVLGIYRYWRLYPNKISLVYPTPIHYKETPKSYPTENLWLIDESVSWEKLIL